MGKNNGKDEEKLCNYFLREDIEKYAVDLFGVCEQYTVGSHCVYGVVLCVGTYLRGFICATRVRSIAKEIACERLCDFVSARGFSFSNNQLPGEMIKVKYFT